MALVKLVRDSEDNVEYYILNSEKRGEIGLTPYDAKKMVLSSDYIIRGLDVDSHGNLIISRGFSDHDIDIPNNTIYSRILNRNDRYAIQCSVSDFGYEINNVLHLRELASGKIRVFDSLYDMLVAFKRVRRFKISFKEILKGEANRIKNIEIDDPAYRDNLINFYGNCYTYFLINNSNKLITRKWEKCLSGNAVNNGIIVKSDGDIKIADDILLKSNDNSSILGIKVNQNRGLAIFGDPKPLIKLIYSSAYTADSDLVKFVDEYDGTVSPVDVTKTGFYKVIGRLSEIMINI